MLVLVREELGFPDFVCSILRLRIKWPSAVLVLSINANFSISVDLWVQISKFLLHPKLPYWQLCAFMVLLVFLQQSKRGEFWGRTLRLWFSVVSLFYTM